MLSNCGAGIQATTYRLAIEVLLDDNLRTLQVQCFEEIYPGLVTRCFLTAELFHRARFFRARLARPSGG
jgi:hypothetical protein